MRFPGLKPNAAQGGHTNALFRGEKLLFSIDSRESLRDRPGHKDENRMGSSECGRLGLAEIRCYLEPAEQPEEVNLRFKPIVGMDQECGESPYSIQDYTENGNEIECGSPVDGAVRKARVMCVRFTCPIIPFDLSLRSLR